MTRAGSTVNACFCRVCANRKLVTVTANMHFHDNINVALLRERNTLAAVHQKPLRDLIRLVLLHISIK